MKLLERDCEKHFLLPSNVMVTHKNCIITTVLGTCVAICLVDVTNHVAGINHYMLPVWEGEGIATPKYGNIAINRLIKKMEHYGASCETMVAKIFGGADTQSSCYYTGRRNVELAEKVLEQQGIEIIARSVGGFKSRKISFDTFSGFVYMKYIN